MGCSFTKGDSDGDANPRIFKVFNVDDQGQELSAGKIEITDLNLILHQHKKDDINWPLRSLRRYGFDAELFSFESGRRCPTGPGIYAFKCRRAEALFNLLQECIQRAGQEEQQQRSSVMYGFVRPEAAPDTPLSNGGLTASLPVSSRASPNTSPHHYINGDIARTVNASPASQHAAFGQQHEYVNTNISPSSPDHGLSTNSVEVSVQSPTNSNGGHVINYAVLDLPKCQNSPDPSVRTLSTRNSVVEVVDVDPSTSQAVFVNLPTNGGAAPDSLLERRQSANARKQAALAQQQQQQAAAAGADGHSYANLELISTNTPPRYREACTRKVNYIQLDLLNSNDNLVAACSPSVNGSPMPASAGLPPPGSTQVPASPISLTSSVPDSPSRRTESYATIDFHRTAALSNSAKTSRNEDEGLRKTRHNSNIEELN